MTLRLCSIAFRSLNLVDVSFLPTFIYESLVIFFGSPPQCSDANNRMLNEMLGTVV